MMVRHFTASAIVVQEDLKRVLLVHHNKIGKWLYPGGHVEPNQTPAETAIREVEEETGIRTRVLADTRSHHPSVTRHPMPFAIIEVTADDRDGLGLHHHIDFVYVLRAVSTDIRIELDEVGLARWVPIDEISRLDTPPDLPVLIENAIRWAETNA
ncbi:NUDIX hydrolase [Paractinoplanes maris]|uniref:NUDIX hydrolase n=1 Tax=Paractinoplanes maris TaxID=1734446 RepID=UPI002021E4AE|nr:NUDIX domain-containing protein [Actinoplanes maris]